tara:strand:+ start:2591 stop:2782 length:192 start_codon:yes stop_codon:yes gene_type:complete
MSQKPSIERNRIKHVNYLMSEIHDSTNQLYEYFMDQEYDKAKKETLTLIKRLREVIQSLENEI